MASILKSATPSADAARGKRQLNVGEKDDRHDGKPVKRNRQRVLLVPSRGVTSQMRHLVGDIEALLPHCKKDSKLDSKSNLNIINELAELNNCNNTLYFESRKHQDLYLWAAKTPNGPSAKLLVQNIHTMDELKMTGNCLKGSRPILSFDSTFDSGPHWALLKEMLTQSFGVPRTSRRVKPFIDHVMTFSVLDGKIWFRNFQIVEQDPGMSVMTADQAKASNKKSSTGHEPTIVEIGPRFVMTPIRIFEGAFGGSTLYENSEYLSPNTVRHLQRRKKGQEYKEKTAKQNVRQAKVLKLEREAPVDELARSRVFK